MSDEVLIEFQYPKKILEAWEQYPICRTRCIVGGRGKGATISFGQKMIEASFLFENGSGLCTRHIHKSHDLSTKKTLEGIINKCAYLHYSQDEKGKHRKPFCRLKGTACNNCSDKFENLASCFKITNNTITNVLTNFSIHFNGLSAVTEDESKGAEGFNIAWISEAQKVPLSALQKFIPSIRKPESEIWLDWNPEEPTDSPAIRYIADPYAYPPTANNPYDDVMFVFMTYEDNPFFSETLDKERIQDYKVYSKEDADWIWLGKIKQEIDRLIYTRMYITKAMQRELSDNEVGDTVIGADIAHMGGDEIVLTKRVGLAVVEQKIAKSLTTQETVENVETLAGFDKEVLINIDNGATGAAVADLLEEAGYTVNRVNFGGKPLRYWSGAEHSANNATDMKRYFNALLKYEEVVLPNDPELFNQMAQRRYNFIKGDSGQISVESKADFAKHYTGKNKSPDRADSVELCFYLSPNEGIEDDPELAYSVL